MELDPTDDPPSGDTYRPEWIPPVCPPECRTSCPAIFGIWTYHLTVYRNVPSVDPRTLRPRRRDVVVVGAAEWYFDKYGCRKADPEASAFIAGAATQTTLFLSPKDTPDLVAYWPEAIQALRAMGVPRPGHIRILPRGNVGIAALAAAASR